MLVGGDLKELSADGALLRYERVDERSRLMILLNLSARSMQVSAARGTVILSTRSSKEERVVSDSITLESDEGLILDCGAPRDGR